MVNIKLDLTWKQWVAIIVATVGSVIIFGALAAMMLMDTEKTRKEAMEIGKEIIEKSSHID